MPIDNSFAVGGILATVSGFIASSMLTPADAAMQGLRLEGGSGQGGFQLETDGFQQQGMRAVDDVVERGA